MVIAYLISHQTCILIQKTLKKKPYILKALLCEYKITAKLRAYLPSIGSLGAALEIIYAVFVFCISKMDPEKAGAQI